MKKNIYILAMLLIFGCSEKLEIEPEQSLSEAAAFANAAAAQSSLFGVYSQAQLLGVFGSQPQIIQDFMADNTDFVGSFPSLQDIKQYVTTTPNLSIQALWQVHYRAINGANTVIDRLPTVTDPALTPALLAQYTAEAKFMRAILYFNLVNIFAQPYRVNNGNSPGVPLVLRGFEGEIGFPARATVAEVHSQIINDLTEAHEGLPASYANNTFTRGRATKGAANGFLARLHLYRGEYQLAAEFAGRVIESPLYQLAGNLGFYNGETPEDVFSIINTAIDNGRTGEGGWASYHRPAALGGRGDCPFSDNLAAAFQAETGDRRYTDLSDEVTAADGTRRRMTRKFPDAATNTDNSPLMRTAEMHLTRAEALVELNGLNQEAIGLVNPIRERAGLPAWTIGQFATKEALIDAILTERRKELCFEGHRRMDLLRKGLNLRPVGDPHVSAAAFGQPLTVLPIPQREMDINPNLIQNPGY